MNKPCLNNQYLAKHADLLISSYLYWTGKELIKPQSATDNIYQALFNAPFGVVSHNTAHDPIFNYANQSALSLFEMDWLTFTQLASRKSAEAVNQVERNRLMARVTKYGFIDDYQGVRISSTGKRFMIENATVWNIINKKGAYCGQAAVFHQYTEL